MKRRGCSSTVIVACACLCAFAVTHAAERAGGPPVTEGARRPIASWAGWRGLAAQGRSTEPLPLAWSATDGIRWKTAIPGRGHSSPIVFGDRVYVTTAYESARGVVVRDALRWTSFLLLLSLAGLVLRTMARRSDPARAPSLAVLAGNAAIGATTLSVIAIGTAGDTLLDVTRSPIRAWIAATLVGGACAALAATAIERRGARLAIASSAAVFAVFTLAAFPVPAYTFRGGLPSLRMQIVLAVSAVPLLVAVAVAPFGWRARVPAGVRRGAAVAVVVAVSAGALLLLHHLLTFRDDSIPDTTYVPRLGAPPLVASLVVVAAGWWWRRMRPPSRHANVAIALGGAAAIAAAAMTGLELVAERSPYLAYQLDAHARQPPLGGSMIAGMLLTSWWGLRRRASDARRDRLPIALTATALAFAAVFFVRVNYADAHSGLSRAIISLDRASGSVVWTVQGLEGPQPPIDGRNSPATPTPATDGRIVCGFFGSPGLLCATTTGEHAWTRTDLPYEGLYGAGFSPVLVDGLVILARDTPAGVATIDAIDARTGSTRWTRTYETTPTFSGNSRTPIIVDSGGEQALVVWSMQGLRAFGVRSGQPLWTYRLESSSGDVVASAVADERRVYLSDVTGTIALDLDDLAAGRDPHRWTSPARSGCASPVLAGGLLFTVTDSGVATATRVDNGQTLWRHRLPGQYFASPIASPRAVYFTNSDGLTTVVAADRTFELLAENPLDEVMLASMAAAGRELFARTAAHLYGIGGR